MKRFLIGILIFTLAGCASFQNNTSQTSNAPQGEEVVVEPAMQKLASLPDLGIAPELTNETWLNVDAPLRLADLHGKVVILEMWTFGCINCQNVMPSLKDWHSKYADQGLVIIGNHFPEF